MEPCALSKHVDTSNFELVTADLLSNEGWTEAVRGCRYVWHVASPVPNAPPKHEDDLINQHLGDRGYKIPTRTLPDFVVRIVGLFDKITRVVVRRLGLVDNVSNERIKRVLGWQPRGTEEMVVATGESLIELGLA